MNALVKKLLHVCITVPDVDKALKFYCDVLGFESTFETRTDEADGPLLGFSEDEISIYAHHVLTAGADARHATEINLIEYTKPATIEGNGPYELMNQVGITRLAMLVLDCQEAFEKIKGYEGVEVVCPPKDIVIRKPDGNQTMSWFSFKDPYGVFITIAEPPKA
ncbi:VOC family protein [Aestuariicella hydrocarbonica]|uniref:VOC family protein n=1 Tax=Pseudomaricurvus hydrocarbonicus TaxID=1470433 RepID=A0A9E5T4V9_9GAMM|nr:VOC family protein [Aestuariicella hydrocarbonica]NHO68314.1 VOC family protein [Aestuariicella hydrocarbonica]